MFKKLVVVGLAIAMSGCVIHIDGNSGKKATEHVTESLTLDANDIKLLTADLGAGDIKIVGVEGLNEIQLSANILTTPEKNYQLTLKRRGNTAELVATQKVEIGLVWYSGNSPRIDLELKVPATLALDIHDESGDVSIANVKGHIELEDGSGDIDISNSGSVTIEDDSGSISIKDVVGNVDIEDGSGDLVIQNVTGNVKISDGSGDIDVNGAERLEIVDSGSGDVSINNIRSTVVVDD
ncbi:DUF4097 domain-containing protein (plasmid) [Pseudoalteromonas xiamenensis]|uniref:hypothetical protein n=1 Tax=Pseudoalteromonas xiamenensis TaxID=882626 RepID=UPI0027E4F755|nr:hypothetical protein [Pseudoalteromonas xiamenensis]WMN61954.1 DUF4097 domain-containing protein [Pseudoalteromonas xiamenensis]